MVDKENKQLAVDWEDELVQATLLTRDGAVVHPAFAPEQTAAKADKDAKAGKTDDSGEAEAPKGEAQ